MMDDFGHFWSNGGGLCLDSWGAGPFIIEAGGRSFRFEDSDRFGPEIIKLDGDPATRQPSERSPFWNVHRAWVKQGRRAADDGVTCVYDPLRPTTYRLVGGRRFIVEEGDEGGGYIDVTDSEATQ